jgi:hypothetical protein
MQNMIEEPGEKAVYETKITYRLCLALHGALCSNWFPKYFENSAVVEFYL